MGSTIHDKELVDDYRHAVNEDFTEFADQLTAMKSIVDLINDKVFKATIPIFGSTFPGGPKGYKSVLCYLNQIYRLLIQL